MRGSIHDVSERGSFTPVNCRISVDIPRVFDKSRFMTMFLEALLSF
jgi:hypothetical protein